MYQGKSILALIPARGGSKGIPRKNIRLLAGKPLIAWTIESALSFRCADKLVVSTEDTEIAEIAKSYGAETPFLRPTELATDKAKGIDVVLQAMDWFEEHGKWFDLVLLLQPTSPLRTAADLNDALAVFEAKHAGAVVSVCETEHSPLWTNTLDETLSMKDFLPKNALNRNRQELDKFYRLNGAIYLANWDYAKKNNGFFGDETYAYIMPPERSVDIDSPLDLQFAEFLLQKGRATWMQGNH